MADPPEPHVEIEITISGYDPKTRVAEVRILGPNDSRASGDFKPEFKDADLDEAVAELDAGRLDTAVAQMFGARLFDAVVRDRVKAVYDASGAPTDASIGVRLVIEDTAVARIPWELMIDPGSDRPMPLRRRFVRGPSTSGEAHELTAEPPLRVLVAQSMPIGVQPLEGQLEIQDIVDELAAAPEERIVTIPLPNATEVTLTNALREQKNRGEPIHVLHWIGHGASDGTGTLLFEKESHGRDQVDGARLRTMVEGYDLRLVFLNACSSAAAGTLPDTGESAFMATTSIAAELLDSGIPCVIGMQTKVLDQRARWFARDFYRSIADGSEVDQAVLDARRDIRQGADGAATDIAIPVCYLRAGSNRLLPPLPFGRRVRTPKLLNAIHAWFGQWGSAGRLAELGTYALAGFLFLGVVGAAISNLPKPPPRLNGDFNIVVADFLATDASGNPRRTALADDLSINLYESLDRELTSLGSENAGGPLNIKIQGPIPETLIDGRTPEERARQAAKIAKLTNAHLVIYGRVDPSGKAIQPEFYVRPVHGAEELSGGYPLGSKINSFSETSDAVKLDLRLKLQARSAAIADFATGLTYLYQPNYVQAGALLQRAVDNKGWPDGDGKEVVWLFRATVAILNHEFPLARSAYERALQVNPEYGRAMFGLGEIDLMESGTCEPGKLKTDVIASARQRFNAALVAKVQPPLAFVPAKAHFGLGLADVCMSQALIENSWADAAGQLEAVVTYFENDHPEAQDLAAEAHAKLAEVRSPAGDGPGAADAYRAVAAEYRAAAELSEHQERRAIFSDSLGWAYEKLGMRAEAAAAYDQAIELAADDPEGLALYRKHRVQLDQSAAPSTAQP